jgi:hypothetical protein
MILRNRIPVESYVEDGIVRSIDLLLDSAEMRYLVCEDRRVSYHLL